MILLLHFDISINAICFSKFNVESDTRAKQNRQLISCLFRHVTSFLAFVLIVRLTLIGANRNKCENTSDAFDNIQVNDN